MVMSLRSKIGRRQGGRSRTGGRGGHPAPVFPSPFSSPKFSKKNGGGREPTNNAAPGHFQRNLLGRGQLAVFPRCSLDPYPFRYRHFTASPARTALKNSHLARNDITIICETVH